MVRPIAEIEADITLFEGLRTQAGTHGIAEYSIDSGQGRQSTKRITLAEIRQTLIDLNEELAEAQSVEAGYTPGVISYSSRRY